MAMGVSSRHTAEQDASVGRLEEATNGAEDERRRRGLFSAGFDRVSRMVVTRVPLTGGNTGPVRFRFGPVPNRPKFKIQI